MESTFLFVSFAYIFVFFLRIRGGFGGLDPSIAACVCLIALVGERKEARSACAGLRQKVTFALVLVCFGLWG